MKQGRKLPRLLAWICILCTLAGLWLAAERVSAEQDQKTVCPLLSHEDLAYLARASGRSEDEWMRTLAEAGLQALLLTPEELDDPALTAAVQAAGLRTAQVGGLPQDAPAKSGMYFLAVHYDTLAGPDAAPGVTTWDESLPQAGLFPALQESGVSLVLVEDPDQTGVLLPAGYALTDCSLPALKCFWLNQSFRARCRTLGYEGTEEIENMLFRAVIDRGITVLWLAPLKDPAGTLVSDPAEYAALLRSLAGRISPAGYAYGAAAPLLPYRPPRLLLYFCGLAVLSAAALLVWQLMPRHRKLLLGLCALALAENTAAFLLRPELQVSALALLASIVFPCHAAVLLVHGLQRLPGSGLSRPRAYLRLILPCAGTALWGGILIGALLSASEYLLVLQIFRGVKLSQAAVYGFAAIYLALKLLHRPGNRLRDDLARVMGPGGRRKRIALWLVLAAAALIGALYLLRTGDGMMKISVLEQRIRNWLEAVLLFRPRTKEFLLAWPAAALALHFARRRIPLLSWLFGLVTATGFASLCNTFCHSRSHFLVSLARSGLGLLLGLLLGLALCLLLGLLTKSRARKH